MATTKRIVKGSPLTATEHDANVSAIDLNTLKNDYPSEDAAKVGYLTITQAVDVDTLEANVQNLLNIGVINHHLRWSRVFSQPVNLMQQFKPVDPSDRHH